MLLLLLATAGLIGLTSTSASPNTTAHPSPGPSETAGPASVAATAPQSLPILTGDVVLSVNTREGENLAALLWRAGIEKTEAAAAAAAMGAAASVPNGGDLRLFLTTGGSGRQMRLAGAEWQQRLGVSYQLSRTTGGSFRLATSSTEIDATPRRFTGPAGPALFWSLRSAGVPANIAQAYVDTITRRLPIASVRATDRFDLVVERRQSSDGEAEWGQLIYAGLDRSAGADIQLVRWSIDGNEQWAEPGASRQRIDGTRLPVSGRLSSGFGYRFHPVLGVGRFHRGIDIAARQGTPVIAANDGIVAAAGWNGGYGRQVTLSHAAGVATSYGHLSAITAQEGQRVRRGDIIGYVGSTGMSTGPHLHFEAMLHGRAVDPMTLRQSSEMVLAQSDVAALSARLKQLLSL